MVQGFQSWARRQAAPITVGFIVSLGVGGLLLWFLQAAPMKYLAFSGFSRPWGVLTYPWAYMPIDFIGLLCFICLAMWLLHLGGTVERELGATRYVAFLAAVTALPAICVGIVGMAAGTPAVLAGPWLTSGALTMVWATRSPGATVNLYGIIPLTAKWLAILIALGTMFSYGFGNPMVGVAACTGYALAHLFAAGRIPGLAYRKVGGVYRPSKAAREKEDKYYDDVLRRERERDERERLRKLFESSLDDDK